MQYLNGDLAQLQVDDQANQRRQEQARMLMQAGMNPVQGGNQWLSLLTSVMSGMRGQSLMKDSDAKASEILAKKFEIENQDAKTKAEAERARRDEDYQRDLQKIDYGNKSQAANRAPRNIDPLSPEGIAASLGLEKAKAGMKPQGGGQTESDRKIAQLRQLGATDDQIRSMLLGGQSRNIDPLSPEGIAAQTKLKGATTAAAGADPKAAAAQQAMEMLNQLEGGLGASGPVDRFLHPMDAQKFDRTKAQLVNPLQTLTRVPGQGAQSDKELATLMASFPDIGNFDDTNKQQIQNLRSYIEKIQGEQGQAMPQGQPAPEERKVINGQAFVKINGQWMHQ